MATSKDYYEILGVSRGASEEEIRRAFRRLARQHHPDVNKDPDAEARFKQINEAYEVLSDAEKRRMYDRFGHAGPHGFGMGGKGGFEDFGFGDIFETFFGMGRATSAHRPQRGADLRYDVTISFEEAIFGAERELEVPRLEVCPDCSGTGAQPGTRPERCPVCGGTGEVRRVQQSILGQFINVTICERCRGEGRVVTQPCGRCHGSGRVRNTRHIAVTIPPGIDDDQQIRIAGEGEPGERGGPPGSLYVNVRVSPHPLFRRQGNDIVCDLLINFAQAALGDELEVPTVDGTPVRVRIPAGTQSGKVLRVKDRGVPYLRGGGRGDQLLKVSVVTPTQLTEEQKQLLVRLGETFGTQLHPNDDNKGIFGKVKDIFGAE